MAAVEKPAGEKEYPAVFRDPVAMAAVARIFKMADARLAADDAPESEAS